MRQPTVDELFDKLENKESNNEIKEIVENEPIFESKNVLNIKDTTHNLNGIVEGTFNYEFIKKQSTMMDY